MAATIQPIKVGNLQTPPSLKGPVNIGLDGDWRAWEIFGVFDHNRNQVPVQTTILNVIGPTGPGSYGGTPTTQSVATKINDLIRQRQDTGHARVTNTNEITLRGKTIRVSLEDDPRQVPWDSPPSAEHIVEASKLIFQPPFPHTLSGKPMSSTLDLHITSHYGVETALTPFPPSEPYEVDTFYIPRVMSSSALNQATKVSTGSLTIASMLPALQIAHQMFNLVDIEIFMINTIRNSVQEKWEAEALTKILQRTITPLPSFKIHSINNRYVPSATTLFLTCTHDFDPASYTHELINKSQPGGIYEDHYTVDDNYPMRYEDFPYTYSAFVLPSKIKLSRGDSKKGVVAIINNPKGYAFIVAQAMLDLIDANQQQALKSHARQRRRIFP